MSTEQILYLICAVILVGIAILHALSVLLEGVYATAFGWICIFLHIPLLVLLLLVGASLKLLLLIFTFSALIYVFLCSIKQGRIDKKSAQEGKEDKST